MAKKISIAKYLSVSAGDEGEETVYTVEPARKFKTESVLVAFPPGTYFELEISIFRGIKQVAPHSGTYRGDACVIEDEFIEDIYSGERVIVKYKNNSSTETRECFILIRGTLE